MLDNHARNLRKGRYSETGRPYLVTTITYNRNPSFSDLQTGRVVVNAMRYLHDNRYVDSLAYVLMPDHLHWLFVLENRLSLSGTVNLLKSWSARRINQQRGHEGAIWQPDFHDHAVRKEEDIRTLARYIIANPLRAGIVADVGSYSLWDAVWMNDSVVL